MKLALVTVITSCLMLAAFPADAKKKRAKRRAPAPAPESVEPEEAPEEETFDEAPAEEVSPASASAEINASEEEEVDLDSLEEEESGPSGHPGGHPGEHGGGSPKMPKFKLFFDLTLEYDLETDRVQFSRDHAYVMLEVEATSWLTFRADIALDPEFYEGIFHLGEKFEVRLGKILVPFGQNEFHHLIGGRVDENSRFLPVVWGDYGLAFKHYAYNGDVVSFDWTLWVLNGFSGTLREDGTGEPKIADDDANRKFDNNQWKGIGLRPKLGLGRAVTLGTSWYMDAWDQHSDRWMLLYGVDMDLGYDLMRVPFLRDIRLRAEIAWMEIKLGPRRNPYHGILAGDSYGIMANYGIRRAGYNIELSYRILNWLILRYREGWINDDSRVRNDGDFLVHEPAILATVGPVRFSLHAEILQMLEKHLETPARDHSRVYLRVLFRY
jgi:hypothetical protein